MVEKRYHPFASRGFLWPVLHVFMFLLLILDVPLALAATIYPLPMNTTHEAIMRDVLGLLRSESVSAGWNITAPTPCQWGAEITCSVSSSGLGSLMVVTGIVLPGYGISNSSIFAFICHLDTLRTLDLSRNFFTDLSAEFFGSSSCPMKGLQSLNLSSNRLSNSLSDIVGFRQLEVLDLSFNDFGSGNLSADLSAFFRLRSLNLSSNNFGGDVPINMVLSLEELVLSQNQFNGSIPEGLFEYRNLITLDLSQNSLTGPVPDNLSTEILSRWILVRTPFPMRYHLFL